MDLLLFIHLEGTGLQDAAELLATSFASLGSEHVLFLVVGDGVAASDVEHVVKGAIALHPKAAFVVAG